MFKKLNYICALALFISSSLFSRDILLEFKSAYFYPTNSCVRDIYGKGHVLYGPEVTFQIGEDSCWYGFASVDFLSKKGRSVGLCDRTKMKIMPLAFGAKYFVPFCYGNFYLGLGFQALQLKTINCSKFVNQKTSKWGFGGIFKVGSYFDLPCDFFVDVFVDYSVARINCDKCKITNVIPIKAKLDGAIFGIGLGRRF